MRFTVHFRRSGKKLLALTFDPDKNGKPTVTEGSDDWLDYSIKPYSVNLKREVAVDDDPWEWAVALDAEYRNQQNPVEVIIEPEEDIIETFGPKLPGSFDFQNPILQKSREVGPENLDRWNDFVLAGWWRRAAAFMIDATLLSAVFVIVYAVMWLVTGMNVDRMNDITETASMSTVPLDMLILLAVPGISVILFACAMFWLTMGRGGVHNGQSVGKQLMGITVIREDGKLVRFPFIFVRQIILLGVVFWLSLMIFYGIFAILNFIWPKFDRKNQTWHDKIVRSVVVMTDVQ